MIAPVAVAGGVIAAGVMPAQAASAATYGVTISATSPNYPGAVHGKVDGYALVIYKTSFKHWNTGVITGDVTGATSGDMATLLAEPFGAKSFTPAATPITLTGTASQPYSFSVQPSLATTYEVQVTTGATVDATSAQSTVYVSAGGSTNHSRKHCSRTSCTYSYRLYQTMPSSAYNTEVKKHLYMYLLVGHPNFPKYFSLSTSARASKARKINAGEYEQVLTFHVKLRGRTQWIAASCTRDSESRDGLGLPGKHGCGNKRFSITTAYLG